ncbi:MAG: CBS domain-containing protein [Actinomycetota bacterium]
MRTMRVSDFMRPLADGETDILPEAARELALRPDDTLETALRVFDTSGAERVPVVHLDRGRIVGWASQVSALARFNKELIASSVEEHR